MNHSTGHGVGLEVHEEPSLRGPGENTLLEGDVVTVEPGLYCWVLEAFASRRPG